MDEIVMQLARPLVSFERLQALSRLAVAGGEVSNLPGARTSDVFGLASGHLAKLVMGGLMMGRRFGRGCYCVGDSLSSPAPLSGMAAAWLRKALSTPKRTLGDCADEEIHRLSAEEARTRVHQLVFEAATAFTDLSRLQILRHLVAGGEGTAKALSKELRMAEWAVSRHRNKLVRRGYLSLRSAGRPALYRLAAQFKTPIHAGVFLDYPSHVGSDEGADFMKSAMVVCHPREQKAAASIPRRHGRENDMPPSWYCDRFGSVLYSMMSGDFVFSQFLGDS